MRAIPWLRLGFIFLLAFAARSLPVQRAFHRGDVFFFGNDAWHQMRRLEFAVKNGLSIPDPDPYLNFPEGGRSHWGPLFTRGTALAARLAGVPSESNHRLEVFAAWVPVVLGSLCCLAAYGIGSLLSGPAVGLLAGVFMAVLPAHIEYSMLGHFDHHVLESLLFGFGTLFLLFARRDPKSLAWSLAAGASLWLLFLTVPGLGLLYAGILWLVCMPMAWERGRLWPAFALPAVLLLPSAFSSLSEPSAGVTVLTGLPSWIMLEQYSFFHPLFLAFCAASLGLLADLRAFFQAETNRPDRVLRLCGLAVIAGALAAALLWPVAAGMGKYLLKGSPWVKYIAEYRPILMPYPDPRFEPHFAFQMATWLFPVFPVLWVWVALRRKDAFLWLWPGILFCLVMLQLRYVHVFAYGLALVLAEAWVKVRESRPRWKNVAAVAAVLAFIPSGQWLWALSKGSRFRYLTISDQDYDMLRALRQNSVPTSGYDDLSAKPEYGVLAPWSLGHAIIYLGRRPVVADPFGHGVEKEAAYYTAVEPEKALAVLRENKARFVVGHDTSDEQVKRIYGDYLSLPKDHPLMKGEWDKLFQMRLLTIHPPPGSEGVPPFHGHRIVHRSDDGRASLFEFKDPGGASLKAPEKKGVVLAPAPRPAAPSPKAQAVALPTDIKTVAALAGEEPITEEDLADSMAVESCYGPDAISSRRAGFIRMLETGLIEAVLAREGGIRIAAKEFEAEERRVDLETKAPDILACIKKRFSFEKGRGFGSEQGRKRYWRVYLRKHMANSRFHKFVNYSPKVQKGAYGLRDRLLPKVRTSGPFPAMAVESGVEYSSHTYSLEEPKGEGGTAGRASAMPWSPFEKLFIEENLKDLAPGKAKPSAIDSDGEVRFARLLSVRQGTYEFEQLQIAKKNAAEYMLSLSKFDCSINDPDLRDWIRSISGNPLLGALRLR
ncbi:MAG: STT3 domain-containing protein [Elusimicrobiota bacterium]|jgi:dolichyl-diphosphooligosaccharide--protein glycosyltransferase